MSLDYVTRLAADVLNVPTALICLIGEDRLILQSAVGIAEPWESTREMPLSHSYCQYALGSSMPLVIDDARLDPRIQSTPAAVEEQWVAYVGVPLCSEGQVLGTLCGLDTEPRAWSPDEIQRLCALAAMVQRDWDAAAFQRQAQMEQQRLRNIVDAQQAIAAVGLDVDAAMAEIAERARRLTGAAAAVIELAEGEDMVYRAACGAASAHLGLRLKIASSISGLSVQTGRILRSDDTEADPRVDADACRRVGARSLVVVPLQLEKHTVGVLKVFDPSPAAFDDSDVEMLQLVAGLLASSLSQARRFQDQQSLASELRVSQERYRSVFQGARDGFFLVETDAAGEFRYADVNPRLEEITGIPVAAFVGSRPEDVLPPQTAIRVKALYARVLETGQAAEVLHTNLLPRGEVTTRTRLHPLQSETGSVAGVLGITEDVTAREQEKTALRDALERYTLVQRATNDTIWDWNLGSGHLSWNEGITTTFGYTPEQVRADVDWWAELLHPDDATRVGASLEAAIQGAAASWSEEYRLRRADGSYAVVQDRGYLQRNEQGVAVRAIGSMQDISVQRLAQTELEAAMQRAEISALRLEAVLEALPVGVFITDEAGLVQVTNPAASTIWGGKAPRVGIESYGQYRAWSARTGEALLPEDWPIARAIRTRRDVLDEELVIQAFDGTPKTVLASGVVFRHPDGEVLGGVAVNVDITDRKRAEQALEEREARFRSLIENASDLITVIDSAGAMQYNSAAAPRILGYAPEELRDRTFFEFTHPDDLESIGGTFERTLRNPGEPIAYNLRFRRSDGTYRWLEGIATNLLTDPSVQGIVANSHDVTERVEASKKLEAYSRELERSNRELQDFAYIASHDLQEPLRKVQAFGDRLKGRYADLLDEAGRDYLERMQGAANRMQTLIQDLLTYSRVTSKAQPFEPVVLRQVLSDVEQDLSRRFETSQGRLEVGELPEIEADPVQMRQLFQNLVGNALKFHREGVAPIVTISGSSVGDTIEIRIQDNGIGFEPQYAERMFRPFERLHGRLAYEGTGIGLAIVRKIVERHNGSIKAEGDPGQGATFLVQLPLQQARMGETT